MKDKILNHMISLFYPINNSYILFNEDFNYNMHVNAINEIEKKLLSYGIEMYTDINNMLPEFAFNYISNGAILVAQLKSEYNQCFMIYIPEKIDDIQNNIICNILDCLNDRYHFLLRKDGEFIQEEDENIFIKKDLPIKGKSI